MNEKEPKLRFSRKLVERQLEFIRQKRTEAATPWEQLKAYALYLKMIEMDTLVALGMVYEASEEDSADL